MKHTAANYRTVRFILWSWIHKNSCCCEPAVCTIDVSACISQNLPVSSLDTTRCNLFFMSKFEGIHAWINTPKMNAYMTFYIPNMNTKFLNDKSTKQSYFLKANNFSGSQEIPRILWKRLVRHSVSNSLPLFHILSQMNPLSIIPQKIFKNYSNTILPSAPKSTNCSLCYRVSSIPTRATYLSHPILSDFVTRIIFGEE